MFYVRFFFFYLDTVQRLYICFVFLRTLYVFHRPCGYEFKQAIQDVRVGKGEDLNRAL